MLNTYHLILNMVSKMTNKLFLAALIFIHLLLVFFFLLTQFRKYPPPFTKHQDNNTSE